MHLLRTLTCEPFTSQLVANPVNPEPSPTNEPVKVEVPATSPMDAPLILPVPKSVATLSN